MYFVSKNSNCEHKNFDRVRVTHMLFFLEILGARNVVVLMDVNWWVGYLCQDDMHSLQTLHSLQS